MRPEAIAWIRLAKEHRLGITLGSPSQSKKYEGIDEHVGILPVVEKIAEIGARCVLDHRNTPKDGPAALTGSLRQCE